MGNYYSSTPSTPPSGTCKYAVVIADVQDPVIGHGIRENGTRMTEFLKESGFTVETPDIRSLESIKLAVQKASEAVFSYQQRYLDSRTYFFVYFAGRGTGTDDGIKSCPAFRTSSGLQMSIYDVNAWMLEQRKNLMSTRKMTFVSKFPTVITFFYDIYNESAEKDNMFMKSFDRFLEYNTWDIYIPSDRTQLFHFMSSRPYSESFPLDVGDNYTMKFISVIKEKISTIPDSLDPMCTLRLKEKEIANKNDGVYLPTIGALLKRDLIMDYDNNFASLDDFHSYYVYAFLRQFRV